MIISRHDFCFYRAPGSRSNEATCFTRSVCYCVHGPISWSKTGNTSNKTAFIMLMWYWDVRFKLVRYRTNVTSQIIWLNPHILCLTNINHVVPCTPRRCAAARRFQINGRNFSAFGRFALFCALLGFKMVVWCVIGVVFLKVEAE